MHCFIRGSGQAAQERSFGQAVRKSTVVRSRMTEPEEHVSPDGALTLAVEILKGGDVAVGFRGYPWHTHADILASIRSCSESHAVREFVDDVLNDGALIAVQAINGDIRDVWISENPAKDRKRQKPHEQLEFRYWSGRQFTEPD